MQTTLKKDRAEQQELARIYHANTFRLLGLKDPFFDIKSINTITADNNQRIRVIYFFESQLKAQVDIYLELTDFYYNFYEKKRILYRFRANPYYQEEYPVDETGAGKQHRVPFEELTEVVPPREPVYVRPQEYTPEKLVETKREALFDEQDDALDKMTIRTFACIVRGIPATKYKWLNELLSQPSTSYTK